MKQKEADLILEENKRLKELNQKLQEDAKRSCEESEAVKAKYQSKESILESKEERLDRRERELNKRSDDIDKEVSSKVINRISTIQDGYDARYERRKADLEEAFDRKKMKMMFVMLVSLLYSITTTVFTAVMNVTIRKDIMVFFGTIFKTVGEMTETEKTSATTKTINDIIGVDENEHDLKLVAVPVKKDTNDTFIYKNVDLYYGVYAIPNSTDFSEVFNHARICSDHRLRAALLSRRLLVRDPP